jgi:HEAT repeats
MRECRFLMILLLTGAFTSSIQAGPLGLFKQKSKPDPAERVPLVIKTLQSDPDERKREQAAEELREYDPKTFPEIVPALIEALKNDASSGVRVEAVSSIGKLKPITQQAGYALEQASAKDPSLYLRTVASRILLQWKVFDGYRSGRAPEMQMNQTAEPPLAEPLPKSVPTPKMAPKAPTSSASNEKTDSTTSKSHPLFPLFPVKNTKPDKSKDDGPVLNPPK